MRRVEVAGESEEDEVLEGVGEVLQAVRHKIKSVDKNRRKIAA